jgi:hypothetical protein
MIGLNPLLSALREAGLPVGIAEMTRLQRVFALEPAADGLRLASVLRALFVKSAEDRAVFDRVFEIWLLQTDHEVRLREEVPSQAQPAPAQMPQRQRRRLRWSLPALLALALACLLLGGHGKAAPRTGDPEPPPKSAGPPSVPQTTIPTPAAIRRQSFTTFVPVLTVTPGPWPGWLPLGLALLALAVAAGSWQALRRRSWFPEPAPEPLRKGPPRVFLTPFPAGGLQLLQPRDEEALVWGIGHFIAEEPTKRLDLPATVRATARAAGFPQLRFHLARHPREVWLWIDEAADDPAISRLANEISDALAAYGLPVERALFRGIPDWLVGLDGQAFAPNEVDARRDTALVALLTDGRILARHYATDDRRGSLDALLRNLSFWPRLTFVDFDDETSALAPILAPHFLDRIAPPDLATFLGAGETFRRRDLVEVDETAVWAAACALAPSPVDEEQAFELRRRLGLSESPWALRALRAEAPGPGSRLHWPAPVRARRINWLYGAESQTKDGLAPQSYLGRALAFWEEVYDQELKERTQGDAGKLWEQTPAYQHLRMERALLALWNERGASEAIRDLHSLRAGALRKTIEEHFRHLAPVDWGGPDLLHLPWHWRRRTATEQAMLLEMRLGGGMPPATLSRPGRLRLGLAACLGLAAGALAGAFLRQPEGPPVLVHGVGKPADALEGARQLSKGAWQVTVATRKTSVVREVRAADRVAVHWQETTQPCVERYKNGPGEIWRCGSFATPLRFSTAPGRRTFLLAAAPASRRDLGAEELAIDLLDSGSADVVLLKPDGQLAGTSPDLSSLAGHEVLAIGHTSWSNLARQLRFEGAKPLRDVWPGLSLLTGDLGASMRGLSACRNGEAVTDQGMVFVRICAGTFMMGSAKGDPKAFSDEIPAHRVDLSEYWIGQTEVTEGQYEGGASRLPVTRVSWTEARDFCKQRGWRLPTEAEWENAARAGTTTAWSFGDDKRVLGQYAWFAENSGFEPHPVAGREPNPWGLYDMHGNAREWVAGWYEPYTGGPQKDLVGPEARGWRVLRGGAFNDSPRVLRSAYRSGIQPEFRYWNIGFRCARSPRRQP